MKLVPAEEGTWILYFQNVMEQWTPAGLQCNLLRQCRIACIWEGKLDNGIEKTYFELNPSLSRLIKP